MSSHPTSDDAKQPGKENDVTPTPDNQGAETEVFATGAKESGADAPTTVLGKTDDHGDKTQVIAGQGTAQPAEWWQETEKIDAPGEPAATHATEVFAPQDAQAFGDRGGVDATGGHHTQELHPGDAAYAAGAASVTGGAQVPPGTPPPPASPVGGQGGPTGGKRSRKTLFMIIGIVAALIIVGGLAGGEAYARKTIENCIASQFEQQMGSKIDVSFGAKPMLLTMIDNKVGSVTVDSDDTKFGPAVGMVVHATFNDIEVKDQGKQGGTIGSSSADVTWSNDGIVKTLGGLVSSATSDPKSGTLSFAVLAGLAELQVKPKIVGNKVEVETMSASLLGFGLPTDLVSGIVELMTESLQTYPMGLQPTAVEVTKDGLHITLKGGPSTLEAVDGQQAADLRC